MSPITASTAQALGQPITLKLSGKTIPNRLFRTAFSEYGSTYDKNDIGATGKPLKKYVDLYQELADGGAGLICFGNIPIDRENLENHQNAILDPRNPWDPVAAFKPAIQAAKSRGAICLPQLQFPGRQVPAFVNETPMSASDVQLRPCLNKAYGKPVPLTILGIQELIERFVWAAEVLAEAGADGIILHASHGYIISQFLSPRTNKRTDQYGGSLENRARFLLELVAAIQKKLPSDKFVLAAKFNCQDFIEGAQTFAEQCVVLKWLEDAGVDFFDISGGTYESPAWRGTMEDLAQRPLRKERGSYFIEWAREMKKVLSRAVIGTTGGWRDPNLMAQAVQHNEIDCCGLGRPLRDEPNLPNQILNGKEVAKL
ncbi:NADH oxidase [Sarocladium strictum]